MSWESAKRALRKATQARLEAALSVPVQTHMRDDTSEWVQNGNITENDTFRAQGFDGGVLNHTIIAWSALQTTAEDRGAIVSAELNDRDNRLQLDAPFYVVTQALQNEPITERSADGPDLFGDLITIRYQIGQRP